MTEQNLLPQSPSSPERIAVRQNLVADMQAFEATVQPVTRAELSPEDRAKHDLGQFVVLNSVPNPGQAPFDAFVARGNGHMPGTAAAHKAWRRN